MATENNLRPHVFMNEERLDERLDQGWQLIAAGNDGIDAVIAIHSSSTQQTEWWCWQDIFDETAEYFDIDSEVVCDDLQTVALAAAAVNGWVEIEPRDVSRISHHGVRECD